MAEKNDSGIDVKVYGNQPVPVIDIANPGAPGQIHTPISEHPNGNGVVVMPISGMQQPTGGTSVIVLTVPAAKKDEKKVEKSAVFKRL